MPTDAHLAHAIRDAVARAIAVAGLAGVARTIGLPGGAGDIGNWTEPLGLASLLVEGSLVVLAAAVLDSRTVATVRELAQAVSR